MDTMPIAGEPALFIESQRAIVIADLHIGIERDLLEKGIFIPSQTQQMLDLIITLIKERKANHLVLLGDLKHGVPRSSGQERFEIPRFLSRIAEHVSQITIVPGNHDGGIKHFLPSTGARFTSEKPSGSPNRKGEGGETSLEASITIAHSKGITLGDVGMWHGHTWPAKKVMSQKMVVMAHNHPSYDFVDTVGTHNYEPCWLKATFSESAAEKYPKAKGEFILMPAFNRLLRGTAVNNSEKSLLGPVLKGSLVSLDNAAYYLLDGTKI